MKIPINISRGRDVKNSFPSRNINIFKYLHNNNDNRLFVDKKQEYMQ